MVTGRFPPNVLWDDGKGMKTVKAGGFFVPREWGVGEPRAFWLYGRARGDTWSELTLVRDSARFDFFAKKLWELEHDRKLRRRSKKKRKKKNESEGRSET